MINDDTTATTAEILLLIDLSKQRLSQLEQAEIIKRLDKDRWPLVATIKALLADARRRSSESPKPRRGSKESKRIANA